MRVPELVRKVRQHLIEHSRVYRRRRLHPIRSKKSHLYKFIVEKEEGEGGGGSDLHIEIDRSVSQIILVLQIDLKAERV